jgi:hypothetical protein
VWWITFDKRIGVGRWVMVCVIVLFVVFLVVPLARNCLCKKMADVE